MTDDQQPSRRRVLSSVAGVTGAMALGSGATAANQDTTDDGEQGEGVGARVNRQLVGPAVQAFEGNYVGQFVIASYPSEKEVSPAVIDDCGWPNWRADQTQLYQGMYLDRLSRRPQYVRVEFYMNANKPSVKAGAPFVITETASCPDDHVGMEVQSVPGDVSEGEPPGPQVTVNPLGASGQSADCE